MLPRFVGARHGDVKRQPTFRQKSEPSCPSHIVCNGDQGNSMITMGIGFGGGVFYWLADYQLAFWILVYAIIYGALSALRGENPRHATGVIYRRGSGLTIAVLIPVALHIGNFAGYF